MAISFPTSLDSLTNPSALDKENSATVPHASQHSSSNDAIEALEAKLGIDSSAVTSSVDYFLKHSSGAYRTHLHDGTSDDGAKLDWDSCWSDAVHTHASAGEGSQIAAAGLATNAVETVKIKDANVTVAKLATDSVETAKIKDANVTAGKLATDSVETAKIKADNVTSPKIAETGWGASSKPMLNYVPRTGAADWDFELAEGDFTTNGTTQDLDLSTIVPSTCVRVDYTMTMKDNLATSYFTTRNAADTFYTYVLYTRIADVTNTSIGNGEVSGQVMKYRTTNTTFTHITMLITGWWELAHT